MSATFSLKSRGIDLGKPYGGLGTSWGAILKPSVSDYRVVDYASGLNLFAVADLSGRLYTSPDGNNWQVRTLPGVARQTRGMVWSPDLNLWVLVSVNNYPNMVVTSPDGITWTERATPVVGGVWVNVTWCPAIGLFVACSQGTIPQIMTSPDGIVWTGRTAYEPVPLLNPSDLAWAPSLNLIACTLTQGSGGAAQINRIMTSPNGINWTPRATPMPGPAGASPLWNSIAWSPSLSLFCATGYPTSLGGNQIMTSPDGINWTLRSPPVGAELSPIFDVVWSVEKAIFVGVLNSPFPAVDRKAVWSANGIDWFTSKTPISTSGYFSVDYGNGMFIAVSGNIAGAIFMRSLTGK